MEYYQQLITGSYESALITLKHKYGMAKEPYAINKQLNVNNNRYQTEGLILHHDKENQDPNIANSLDTTYYQQPMFLTYANVFEHFILHLLIQIENKQYNPSPVDNILVFDMFEMVAAIQTNKPTVNCIKSQLVYNTITKDIDTVLQETEIRSRIIQTLT